MKPKTKAWHSAGGKARAEQLSPRRRRQIARMGGFASNGPSKPRHCSRCGKRGHYASTCEAKHGK
jgi:hypothetical protein